MNLVMMTDETTFANSYSADSAKLGTKKNCAEATKDQQLF
jgi:hypothetical protein